MDDHNTTQLEQIINEISKQNLNIWLQGDELRIGGEGDALQDELINRLRRHKSELIDYLKSRQTDTSTLSFAQFRLWFLQQLPHEAAVYNVPLAIKISGRLDLKALKESINQVMYRHDVLRTRYPAPLGQPLSEVTKEPGITLPQADLTCEDNRELQLKNYLLENAAYNFDLKTELPIQIALYKLDENEHVLSIVLHHIACDAWSLDILIHDICTFYRANILGLEADLATLQSQYQDFARWQRERLQGVLLDQQQRFWIDYLQGIKPLDIPTDHPRPKVQQHQGSFVEFKISKQIVSDLNQIAQQNSATMFMTLLAAFKILLFRYTGQQDIAIGTPISNRQSQQFEGLVGLFVNTLILRTKLDCTDKFEDILRSVRASTLAAMNHQDLPFEQLIDLLKPERDMSRNPLFQVKFRLENTSNPQINLPDIKLEKLPQALISSKVDLSMDLYETPDGIIGGLEYDTHLFEHGTIERLADHFVTLLGSITNSKLKEKTTTEKTIANLSILSLEQQQQQLSDWNDTQKAFRDKDCFHQIFEEIADKYRNDIALIFDDGNKQTLSYGECNSKANQLAHWLIENEVTPESVVAICMNRSIEMIVALLGIMKAGGAYLPIDANYPEDRIGYMLNQANVSIILSQNDVSVSTNAIRLDLDLNSSSIFDNHPTTNPNIRVLPNNLAYLIFTSGSTGLPKGVMIEHQGLVNLTEDKLRKCDVRTGDCVLQFFSFSFDASVPEIIMPLAVGGKLLLTNSTNILPGPELANMIERNEVTHITMTPSALRSLPFNDYPALRMVLVGGEAPTPELIEQWSANGRQFINAYGPTETTVNASMVHCGNEHPLTPTLLPSANKQLYILDQQQELLPVGATGELCIGGVGLARGYLNRPDLTAKAFIPNPFYQTFKNTDSKVIYRTGDLACYQEDGRIRILGRVDNQVKIRGYRVELGDIEHHLNEHEAVKTSVVMAIDDEHIGKRLVAFAVKSSEEVPSTSDMRHYVGEHLPAYMIPNSFHWLSKLPLTSNDKIDTRHLQSIAEKDFSESVHVPPRNETEQIIANFYADLLGRNDIGSDTDFFDAGGHSLLATQLVVSLLEKFDVEINVIDLFEAPTVSSLALRIEQKLKLNRLQQT
ncbi:MAG: amino acid adenylation domain-containing protein, partial [Pseudomonadota bacterium]